jgi:dienelactone hydrolase
MNEGGMCPGCVSGFTHDGTPKGTTGTIANLPTYIAKPTSTPAKPGIIVLITDVFGWEFVNCRILADKYAEMSGRTVYVPDFMSGKTDSL